MSNQTQGGSTERIKPLGLIAGFEVAIRGVGSTSLVDVAELLGEGILLALVITLTEGWVGHSLSILAMWLLYGLAIYSLLPGLLPPSLSDFLQDNILRGLVTVGVIVFANLLSTFFGQARSLSEGGPILDPTHYSILQISSIIILLTALTIWLYLKFGRSNTEG